MGKTTGTGNKGQMIGQVFIFILAGLIFVLIITYGYRAVQHFLERQEEVVLLDVKTDLEIATEGVKRDFGSVRKLELRVPADYAGLCVFDPVTCASEQPILEHSSGIMRVDWAQESCRVKSANVFLVPRELDVSLPDIEVPSPGYFCVANQGGVVALRLEGTGRRAKMSPWS